MLVYCDLKASFVGFAVGAGMTQQADHILQDSLSHLYSNALLLDGVLLLFGNLVIISTQLKNILHFKTNHWITYIQPFLVLWYSYIQQSHA